MRRVLMVLGVLALAGCDDKEVDASCDATSDADSDGLDDCTEESLGTDPSAKDSDGDGLSDGEEIDCISDPLDGEELCYECGWPHNDPGTLSSTGAEEGDTIANLELIDQCGEMVALWDMAEEYHILFITAEW